MSQVGIAWPRPRGPSVDRPNAVVRLHQTDPLLLAEAELAQEAGLQERRRPAGRDQGLGVDLLRRESVAVGVGVGEEASRSSEEPQCFVGGAGDLGRDVAVLSRSRLNPSLVWKRVREYFSSAV
jgi:hypothetical protein